MADAAASADEELKMDPARAAELASNLARTLASIKRANAANRAVRLVAVSKLKPASDILSLISPPAEAAGAIATIPKDALPHLHFGENYTQELQRKAALLPRRVRWHFIGALQTNKCRPLAEGIPNLWAVESVDAAKKADALEKGRRALRERLAAEAEKGAVSAASPEGQGQGQAGEQKEEEEQEGQDPGPLRVFVQINTSGEESKSGVEPGAAAIELARHVVEACPNLKLQGVMTIGAIARSEAAGQGELNEDFVALKAVREDVCRALGRPASSLELSMGMSADYEEAIREGSDQVRVGTGIFGTRPPKKADAAA